MKQIELEKIADYFDRDNDGLIHLSEINSSLAKRQPPTDSEKIDYAVRDESLHNYYIHTHYTGFSPGFY